MEVVPCMNISRFYFVSWDLCRLWRHKHIWEDSTKIYLNNKEGLYVGVNWIPVLRDRDQ
jgi:hypothetical protein